MTIRRRLRSLLTAAGVDVVRIGESSVVLSRKPHQETQRRLDEETVVLSSGPRLNARRLGRRSWLVQSRRKARLLAAERIGDDAWVVRPRQGSALGVRRIGPTTAGTHLVFDHAALQGDIRRFEQGLFGFLSTEHVAWMLRELDVNCVLDAGANTGQYAQALRAAGYDGRIVSFEPLPHLVEELEAKSADDPNWIVVPVALGDRDEESEINVVPGSMSSMLTSSSFGKAWAPVLREMRPQRVSVRRLDGLLDEALDGLESPRVYLKMDTQGYDLQVVAGAGDRLAEFVGMQSEVACVPIYDGMPRLIEQLAVYEDAGFSLTGMFPVTIDRRSLRVIEFDAVLIRQEALPSPPSTP